MKQAKVNKLTPPFNPDPHVITAMKGNMITAKSRTTGRFITRSSSFFKKIPNCVNNDTKNVSIVSETDISSDSDNDIDLNGVDDMNVPVVPRRNPIRQRNRPKYLQDDIRRVIDR